MNNIGKIIKEKGTSQKAIAIALGVSQPTVSDWVSGKKSPSSKRATELADYFNVSIDLLLGRASNADNATLNLSPSESTLLNLYRNSNSKIRAIAVSILEVGQLISSGRNGIDIGDVKTYNIDEYIDYPASAGTGTYIDDAQKETLQLTKEPPSGACYVCRVSGDSMHGLYEDGDRVFVSVEPVSEGGVGIFIYNNEIYIKRAGKGCLLSENPDYPPIIIHDSDSLFCIGTVLGKVNEDDIITD